MMLRPELALLRRLLQGTGWQADVVGRLDIGVVAVHLDEYIISLKGIECQPERKLIRWPLCDMSSP
jgi:hypothetical protein